MLEWISGDVLPTKKESNDYYIVYFDSEWLLCPVLCRYTNEGWKPVYQNRQGYNSPTKTIDEKVKKYAYVE